MGVGLGVKPKVGNTIHKEANSHSKKAMKDEKINLKSSSKRNTKTRYVLHYSPVVKHR